jgi:hypothetical protein
MSANPFAQGTVAGVELVFSTERSWLAEIVDGGNFELAAVGTIIRDEDGAPHQNIIAVDYGVAFGLSIKYAPLSVIQSVMSAIKTAIVTGDGTFAVDLDSGFRHIQAVCLWDWEAAPRGPQWPPQRENTGTIENWVARFITAGPLPEEE